MTRRSLRGGQKVNWARTAEVRSALLRSAEILAHRRRLADRSAEQRRYEMAVSALMWACAAATVAMLAAHVIGGG